MEEYKKLVLFEDGECQMAMLMLDEYVIALGNYWDFHVGCWRSDGIVRISKTEEIDVGKYKTRLELAYAISAATGIKLETDRGSWTYTRGFVDKQE